MKGSRLAVLALALAAVGALGWYLFGRGDGRAPRPAAGGPPSPGAVAAKPAGGAAAPSGPGPSLSRGTDPDGPLLLEGQVLDERDQPVAGAEVWISSSPPRTATSEADGTFSFDKLLGRTYAVGARAGELVGGPVQTRVTAEAEPVVIRLRAGATVIVTVRDAERDRPVADATVTLERTSRQTATSGADGVARLTGIGDGWVVVTATAPGYALGSAYAVIGKSQRTVELTLALRAGVAVSGVVVDDAGAPIAGAKVWPKNASTWELVDGEDHAVTSDAKGAFTIAAVAPGSYRLVALDEVHARGQSELVTVTAGQPTTGVRIVLPAAGRISGVVVDGAGAPSPYATVRVSGTTWSADMVNHQVAADDRGQFVVDGMPRQALRIRAESEQAASTAVAVDLTGVAERKDLRLVLDQTGTISGVVVDSAGQPVPEASVTAVPDFLADDRRGDDLILASSTAATTDGGGRFVLRGLEDGSYRLSASRAGHGERQAWGGDATPVRTGATDVRLVLPTPGGVRGTIVLAGGGAPELAVVAAGWEHRVTTKDGDFELTGMNPGPYDLRVTGADFAEVGRGDVIVKAGAIVDVGKITVTAGRRASGRVVDDKGAPVAGAKVLVGKMLFGDGAATAADPNDSAGQAGLRTATTSDDGSFVVRGLGKDRAILLAEHPERGRSVSLEVPPGTADVNGLVVKLRGFGKVTGRVTRKGEPVGGATINAAPAGSSGQAVFVQAGADGTFVLDKVPAGPTAIQAMRTQMMSATSASRTITVVAGETVDGSIDMPAGDVNLLAKVEPKPGATINAATMMLFRGAFAADNARHLMDAYLSARGTDGAAGMENWLGTPTFPTFRELVPGRYTLCAIPITGNIFDQQFSQRIQANFELLAAVCSAVTVTPSPTEQTKVMVLPEMNPLPPPAGEGVDAGAAVDGGAVGPDAAGPDAGP